MHVGMQAGQRLCFFRVGAEGAKVVFADHVQAAHPDSKAAGITCELFTQLRSAAFLQVMDPHLQAGEAARPEDIDVIELHDAFTIAELVYYEALGLCNSGQSAALLRDGATTYGGKVVVNPSGGLLAKGHPVGASGAAQAVEVFWHLTGQAGARQVDGARLALTHVTGGGISGMDHGACTVHLYEANA